VARGRETQEHDEHPSGSDDEAFAAAEGFHEVDTQGCHAEVDAVQDHLGNKGVVYAGGLEDYGAVVWMMLGLILHKFGLRNLQKK
jgi:hypothetical protein